MEITHKEVLISEFMTLNDVFDAILTYKPSTWCNQKFEQTHFTYEMHDVLNKNTISISVKERGNKRHFNKKTTAEMREYVSELHPELLTSTSITEIQDGHRKSIWKLTR